MNPSNTGNSVSDNVTLNGQANLNGNRTSQSVAEGGTPVRRPTFDQPVILRQSPKWSRAIVWTIVSVTALTVTWACLAKVEETVPTQGKLEPKGIVQPVQAPVGGVIKELHVKEGDTVEPGQALITLDQTTARVDLKAARELKDRLLAENAFFRAQLNGDFSVQAPASISADLQQRMRDREALLANNKLYRAQINGTVKGLDASQRDRLATAQSELNSQQRINALQVNQLREQLTQTSLQLANAKSDLRTNQEILKRLRRLLDEGAVGELTYLNQEQEVNNRLTQVNTLEQEEARLKFQISQAQQEINRTGLESRRSLQDRISSNDERIAELDSQLTQRILENDKQVQELNSRITQLEQTLKYQVLTAPVGGTVFNLKANEPGYVVTAPTSSQFAEPVLEIVPSDSLVARVYIPNKDIGFVKVGQPVDVRIDAFSFSEYGGVEGQLKSIGTDALEPNEIFPFYRFPAEIELDKQYLESNGQSLKLRSGMSVSAVVKLRKRRVITFFTDMFVRKIDSFRSGS